MKNFNKILLCLAMIAPGLAFAQQANGTLTSTATVPNACSVTTVDHINMGAIDTITMATAEDTGILRVQCTIGTYNLYLNNGANVRQTNLSSVPSGANYTKTYTCQRRMTATDGPNTVAYNIYLQGDPLNYNNKSVTSAGSAYNNSYCSSTTSLWKTLTFTTLTGSIQDLTIIGRSFPNTSTTSAPGAYVDTLTYTIEF